MHILLFRLIAAFTVPLLFSSCAANPSVTRYPTRINSVSYPATTVLQEFLIGGSSGILQRSYENQLQIRVFDRTPVIELGALHFAQIDNAQRFGAYDLIAVLIPSAACHFSYRLYQISGQKITSWPLNDVPGRCGYPLIFSGDSKSWIAGEQSSGSDRQVWAWAGGHLTGGADLLTRVGSSDSNFSGVRAAQLTSVIDPAPGLRFESSDNGRQPVDAGTAPVQAPSPPTSPSKTPGSALKPIILKKPIPTTARRVPAGNYDKLPTNRAPAPAPVKVNLRDND